MRRSVYLAGVLPFMLAFLGSLLALSLAVPSLVAAQEVENPRITGVVESVVGGRVTLTNGQRFMLGADPVRLGRWADAADRQPGQEAGITTQVQSNGTLVVVSVHIFRPDFNFAFAENPIAGASGNTMVNAIIEDIQPGMISFRLPGGSVTAILPPDIPVIDYIRRGTPEDIQVGARVAALTVDGVIQHVYVEYDE